MKDKARVDLTRGAIRVMGTAKQRLMRAIGWAVVNYKILNNFEAWQADPARRRRKPRRRKPFTLALEHIRPATPVVAQANSPPAA